MSASKTAQCCVLECGCNSYCQPHLQFHVFPKPAMHYLFVTNESGIETRMDVKEIWEMILLVKNVAHPSSRVCSRHFQTSDYCPDGRLFPTAIPTLELPQLTPRYKKDFCMVEFCRQVSVQHPHKFYLHKRFFTLNRPSSDFQAQRWRMWRAAMWNDQEKAPKPYVPLTVCADHFIGGEPSNNPRSVDFVPSRNLPKYRIEVVNVNESFSVMWDTTNQDPLELPEAEAEPEFVGVDGGLESEVKIEIDEVELEDPGSGVDDHCYC